MPAPVIIGVVAAVVVVAVVLVLVLRRRARVRYAEPVVRRVELAGPARSLDVERPDRVDAASAPAPASPSPARTTPAPGFAASFGGGLRHPGPSGADAVGAERSAEASGFFVPEADGTEPPLAPILHFDTVEVSTIEPSESRPLASGSGAVGVRPAEPGLAAAVPGAPAPAATANPAPMPWGTAPSPSASTAALSADETVIVRLRGAGPEPAADPDATVISERRRAAWYLETQNGQRIELPGAVCIVGRRPHPVATHPSAALVSVDDPGKTVSGTHALFELVDGDWLATDLDSTNGVVVLVGGFETAIPTRTRTRIDGDFYLGDLGVRIVRES